MRLLSRVKSFLRGFLHKQQIDAELDDEIRSTLELLTEQKISEGMNSKEARRAAGIELGGVEQVKERVRAARAGAWLESLLQDVRFGLRMLRKNPGFTAVVVITLALGIGANTALFSVVQGVVLAPLPYPEPDRLVAVGESNPRFPLVAVSYPNFRDKQRIARSFEQMAAFGRQGYNLTGPGTPEHLDGKEISSGFFSTLGVKLTLGRGFSPAEDVHGGAPVVIISDRLFRNRFDGQPEALGKSLTLDGVAYTIIGVTPPGFHFEGDADVYTPLGEAAPLILNIRASHWLFPIGRLRPGVSVLQAQAEMSAIQKDLDQIYPDADRDLGMAVVPLKQQIVGNAGGTLLLLLGAVGLVLLIACANVANLLLARSAARTHEFAVRSALGANRTRIARQLITESVLLSLAGGALGVLIAFWGVSRVPGFLPGRENIWGASRFLPRSENIAVNLPVLLFAFSASIAVGILFGLAPALKNWNVDLQPALKEGGHGFASGHHRAQRVFVIAQMASTLMLLVGAGLLFRTLRSLWEVNPGFDTHHVITFRVGVSPSLTNTASRTRIAYQQLIERIRGVPGVQAADFTDVMPLTRQGGTMPFWIGSQKPASLQAAPRLVTFLAGPDYFQTMGIPLLRGRLFTSEDTITSPHVVVIDSVFAHLYFPNSNPLGQTITFGFSPTPPCQIVGVVGHVKDWGLQDPAANVRNQLYFPLYQDPDPWVADNYADLRVIVRTPLDPATVMPAIKPAVYEAGSEQPVYDVQTMQQIVSASMSSQRYPMILLGVFAGLALLLASVGLYGVISYSVAQRVREIGIRMALGAERWDVFRMVIGHGLRLALVGLEMGAVAALILTRIVSSFSHLLYGVGTNDPLTFVVVSVVLTVVAVLACYIPARRAMRVDPMVALRYE
ncbi:MAG TPA: ABC transporter permease [Candidatus Acidoferrales bacterium]